MTKGLHETLGCPADGTALLPGEAGLRCPNCKQEYVRGEHGYFELLVPSDPVAALETLVAQSAHGQERGEARIYDAYLRGWLQGFGARRVLDAGCGPGLTVAAMLADGLDAYGVDLPTTAPRWRELGLDQDHYFCGNVTRLPFQDAVFDAVLTVGVVEHIGTTTGHVTLGPTYQEERADFARELLRVTRPGGRILVACPNKRFPVDLQHGPNDQETQTGLRARLFERTGINVHRVVGAYHLASYSDVARWFRGHAWRALPLRGFFGFSAFDRSESPKRMMRFARRYVEGLPAGLRRSALNPYVLVEVTA